MILLTFWAHDGYFHYERYDSVPSARKRVREASAPGRSRYNAYYISVIHAEIEVQGCAVSELL